jgi:hypothetical protein
MDAMKDSDLLKELRERYKEADDHWRDNRNAWLEDAKFRAGEHWPPKIKKEREDAGRPVIVSDKTEQYVRQVVNDGRQNRPAPRVSPVDSKGDVKVAEAYKGLIRSIFKRSNGDDALDTALDNAAGQGFGFIRLVTQYESDRTFHQEIAIRRVRNPMGILLARHQEADGSDADYGFVADEIRKDSFKKQWPKAKIVNWNDNAFADGWSSDTHVRIVEYFYKVTEPGLLYLLDDNTTATPEEYERDTRPVREDPEAEGDFKPAIVSQREVPITKVKWCRASGAEILEKKDWPGKYIPIIPVYGVERDINGKVTYEGLIRPAKDEQRMYNYGRAGFAEHVSLSTKVPWVAAAGQLEGFEDEWEKANRENVAVLHYNPVSLDGKTALPAPSRPQPTTIPAILAQDMQVAEHGIQGAMGMYAASIGERSNEKSGKAILARQREGDTGTFHYHDNMNRAIRYLCRQLVDLIPKVIDNQRTIRLIAEDGKATVAMNDPNLGKPFEQRGELMVYNLGSGMYDVDVEAGPSYTTKRQEAAEAMMELARAVPELVKVAGDLMIRNMDWPGAEEIANRLKKMLPPELQDDGQVETPEVKAVKVQAQQFIDRLTQQIEAAEQGIAQRDEALATLQREAEELRAKLESKAAEATAKLQQADTGQYKAETERMQVVAPAITPQDIAAIVRQTVTEIMAQPVPEPPMPVMQPQEPAPAGFFTPEGAP